MKPAAKKYTRDFLGSIILYGALLFAVNSYLKSTEVLTPVAIALALLPMTGVFLALRAVLVFSRTWDELERLKVMEAVLISFVCVGMGTLAYGFLEGVGFPRMGTHWVFVLLIGTMGLAQVYTAIKYK